MRFCTINPRSSANRSDKKRAFGPFAVDIDLATQEVSKTEQRRQAECDRLAANVAGRHGDVFHNWLRRRAAPKPGAGAILALARGLTLGLFAVWKALQLIIFCK